MISVPVYSQEGELIEELSLDEEDLGGCVRRELLRQAILSYEANQRSGNAKTKPRSEVAFSGAKPWPQKHTGRARAGSRSSPVWVGGGTAFGPQPRSFRKKMSRKMRAQALASALLAKVRDGEVRVLDSLELPMEKTREVRAMLDRLGVDGSFMVVLPDHDPVLWRCVRNIPGSSMRTVRELNAYEVVRPGMLLFTKEAWEKCLDIQKSKIDGRKVS